jgi:hypothetical protein
MLERIHHILLCDHPVIAGRAGQPFQHTVMIHGPGLRHQSGLGLAIGDILQERDHLGQRFSAVELQDRHHAFRVHIPEILAALGHLGLAVHALEIGSNPGFMQRNVDGERAGSGRVIQLHVFLPGAPAPTSVDVPRLERCVKSRLCVLALTRQDCANP